MRTLISTAFVSLDGVMEAPGGDALKKAQVLDGSAARRR